MSPANFLSVVCPWALALALQLRDWLGSWHPIAAANLEGSGKTLLVWVGVAGAVVGIFKNLVETYLAWRRSQREAEEAHPRPTPEKGTS
jgi:hypothetical protein